MASETIPGSASSNEMAVCCRGVTKNYGSGQAKVAALRGIDLDVQHGELLMIVGPSGCGKTTLLSVITTILSSDSGQTHVLGRDLQQMDERERAYFRRDSIGFLFQMFNLLPTLTAGENVAIPLLIGGIPWESAKARAESTLETVGLGTRATAPRRFPPPWSVEERQSCFIVKDGNGQTTNASLRRWETQFSRAETKTPKRPLQIAETKCVHESPPVRGYSQLTGKSRLGGLEPLTKRLSAASSQH
jgi:ABC-type lipoprotein export system ATPase subunit